VGRTLPSPLPIRRSFRNAVTRRPNVASHADRPKRTIRAVAQATVPLLLRELPLSVRRAVNPPPSLLSRAGIGQSIVATVTHRGRAAAANAVAPTEHPRQRSGLQSPLQSGKSARGNLEFPRSVASAAWLKSHGPPRSASGRAADLLSVCVPAFPIFIASATTGQLTIEEGLLSIRCWRSCRARARLPCAGPSRRGRSSSRSPQSNRSRRWWKPRP
jgi:hypothetical protein